MAKRGKISIVFFVLLILSILLLILSKSNLLSGPQSLIAQIFSPFQSVSFSAFNFLSNAGDEKTKRLEDENRNLLGKLVNQDKIIADNKALRDQFEKGGEEKLPLLPARIVGAPSFIPGITDPSVFILDKGSSDGVRENSAVVYQNILVGKIISVTDKFSKVGLITNQNISFTVKDQRSGAGGVLQGDGGKQMNLDNVVQSEEIKEGDIIVSKGSQKEDGRGFPPDLIAGKIKSFSKKPSEVFQRGKVISPLDFKNLSTVFIVVY